ncbi:unnamed protein product [Thelazia callipaeda]|uniref:ZM domain-containing protein n=1 Tax=Thelazia callipaeda TaxID=103827 RepID=A0A0N5CM64_THECL|nr:unnamed protein product [Thelazia callipaeda]
MFALLQISKLFYFTANFSEAAEEQYKLQVGTGPDHALGASDRYFDPSKSETLKAIIANNEDNFGQHFKEQIMEAEIPHVPPPEEPSWVRSAKIRSERARSATPTATYVRNMVVKQPHYTPQYSTLPRAEKFRQQRFHTNYLKQSLVIFESYAYLKKTLKIILTFKVFGTKFDFSSHPAPRQGYEFGGLDYVDKSRIPQSTHTNYEYNHMRKQHKEHKVTPGYEMGGTDFRKGAVGLDGPYHGHGPEHPRLQPKFEHSVLKHDEMNIEVAPNVDRVTTNVLVGDTRSNQHLNKDQHFDHSFGTSFGPPAGFTHQHRTLRRQEEGLKPTTFSLSAKKDHAAYKSSNVSTKRGVPSKIPLPYHTSMQASNESTGHHVVQPDAVAATASHTSVGTTDINVSLSTESHIRDGEGQIYETLEQPWNRSQSAAPLQRYEWNSGKEITIETLLNDKALIARKRSTTPEWHSSSLEKHKQWKNRSDPRFTRSQIFDTEPTWSRIVTDRRNTWEEKARKTDARIQMPPSSKIPPEQAPFWYHKANETHTLWQSVADRQSHDNAKTNRISNNYREQDREQHDHHDYMRQRKYAQNTQDVKHDSNYDGFISQTQYMTHPHVNSGADADPTFHSVGHEQTSEHETPSAESSKINYSSIPVGLSHIIPSGPHQQISSERSQSSSLQYQNIKSEHSTGQMVNKRATLDSNVAPSKLADSFTVYQRKTHHETYAPYNTSVVSVTQGGGDFNRQSEMAEMLPKGTIASTEASTQGNYIDKNGQPVTYKRELLTSLNPNSESTLLKEEERRVVETPLEPGVISRHITTKYYKKKTVTDTTTSTTTS